MLLQAPRIRKWGMLLNATRRTITRGDVTLKLPPTLFTILKAAFIADGQVHKERLFHAVYGEEDHPLTAQETLRVQISNLNKRIADIRLQLVAEERGPNASGVYRLYVHE